MNRVLRVLLTVGAVILFVIAVGFILQMPWATALWPVPSGRLGYFFIASMTAAIAAPMLWIGLSGEMRAMAGGSLNLGVTSATFAGYSLLFAPAEIRTALLPLGLLSLILLAATVVLYRYSSRLPFRDQRPMPGLVRIAFWVFAALLLLVGGALALRIPNVFPWQLGPHNSVFYGLMFLGAMCYFLYGLRYPAWANARGQLLGFLAYDAVLIPPFFGHFATVAPEMRLSLVLYFIVVTFSAVFAVFMLFFHPATRFRRSAAPFAPQVPPVKTEV